MKQEIKQQIGQSVQDFRLPRYQEIPDVGLYLEQATKYICRYLSPILETPLTASMISNYVKRGLLSSPVKKQYSRDQVAYLFFIAVAKNVLSLDALACFLRLQERTYPLEKAYNYFCRELENLLLFQFEVRETIESSDEDSSDEKRLLYSCTAAGDFSRVRSASGWRIMSIRSSCRRCTSRCGGPIRSVWGYFS